MHIICAFDVAYDTTCEYSNDFAFHACDDACDEKMKRANDDRTQHTKMSKRYFPTA